MMMVVLRLLFVLQLIHGHRDENFDESSLSWSTAAAAVNHRISLQDTVYYYDTGAAQYLTIPSTDGGLMSMGDNNSFRRGDWHVTVSS